MKQSLKKYLQKYQLSSADKIALNEIDLTHFDLDISFDSFLFYFKHYSISDEQKDYMIKNFSKFDKKQRINMSPLEMFFTFNEEKKLFLTAEQIHVLIDNHDTRRSMKYGQTILSVACENNRVARLNLKPEHWEKLIEKTDFKLQMRVNCNQNTTLMIAIKNANYENLNFTTQQWLTMIEKSMVNELFLDYNILLCAFANKTYINNNPKLNFNNLVWKSLIDNTVTDGFCNSQINILNFLEEINKEDFVFLLNNAKNKKSIIKSIEEGKKSPRYKNLAYLLQFPEVIALKEKEVIDFSIDKNFIAKNKTFKV